MRRVELLHGFGLLEALVALTLLASVGVTLFGWINNNLMTASRLRSHEQAQQQRQIAQAWLQTVDLWRDPEGEAQPVPGWKLRWSVKPVSALSPVPPWTGGSQSAWESRLVELEVSLQVADERPQQFGLTRVAVRRTQPFPGDAQATQTPNSPLP